MKQLIITYIIIVIFQLIYTIYVPMSIDNENIVIVDDEKKEEKIQNFIKEKLKILIDASHKMSYTDWLTYLKKNSNYEYEGNKLYVFAWKYSDIEMSVVNYPDKTLNNSSQTDFFSKLTETTIKKKYNLSIDAPKNMFLLSKLNTFDTLTYFWIDYNIKDYVKKKSVFTKFSFDNSKITGIIGMGYNIENLHLNNKYKNFQYIYKPELLLGSVISIILSLFIIKIDSRKYYKTKAFVYLIIFNIYIFLFINIPGNLIKINDENQKIKKINSSILSLSFLSSIFLFILTNVRTKNNSLFIELSLLFSISIILLLTSIYKSTNQNSIFDITGATITNTFLYNYAVLINFIIFINFFNYLFYKK